MKPPSPLLEARSFTADDELVLRESLEQVAREVMGGSATVTGVERVLSNYSSSYGTHFITVRLDGGAAIEVFMKDFGFSQLPKDEKERRRDRELHVYRDLLPGARLGTAAYYRSIWDEAAGRFWLLMELVKGREVRSCPLEYWIEAAGWLGRLHHHFEGQATRLRASSGLLRHDEDYFRSRADMALRDVSTISVPLADRLRPVVERYEPLCDVMGRQPVTLVHGAYRPANILVNTDTVPARMCPVDWELASCGSPLYDLASWTDGFEPHVLDRLFDAYRRWAPLPSAADLTYLLGCFRLHRVMNWLSRAREKQFTEAQVDKLVARGERLDAEVHGGHGQRG